MFVHGLTMRRRVGGAMSWLLCVPLIVLALLPAFAYTLATNVPAVWGSDVFGDPFVIACVQFAFNAVVFPGLIKRIVRMAYTRQQIDRLTSGTIIQINSHKLFLSVVVELVSTLVAPMVATLLVDESCNGLCSLRYAVTVS